MYQSKPQTFKLFFSFNQHARQDNMSGVCSYGVRNTVLSIVCVCVFFTLNRSSTRSVGVWYIQDGIFIRVRCNMVYAGGKGRTRKPRLFLLLCVEALFYFCFIFFANHPADEGKNKACAHHTSS